MPEDTGANATERFFDWLFDEYPSIALSLLLLVVALVAASLIWGIVVVVTVAEGRRLFAFGHGYVATAVASVSWLWAARFEVLLVSLLLVVIYHLARLDRITQSLAKGSAVAFERVTAINTPTTALFSTKELIEARERADEADAAKRASDLEKAVLNSVELDVATRSDATGPVPEALLSAMKNAVAQLEECRYRRWQYERMLEANLRVAQGQSSVVAERERWRRDWRENYPHPSPKSGGTVQGLTREWAERLFRKDRLPQGPV